VDSREEVTRLLGEIRLGNVGAKRLLWQVVYEELHCLAEAALSGQRDLQTLQPTALVHETFLRLFDSSSVDQSPNRRYFYGAAATAMRRILVDYWRTRHAQSNGGGWRRTPLDDALAAYENRQIDLLELDEALKRLQSVSPRQYQIVDEYHFGGFTMREIADHLGVSEATVSVEFRRAQRWLAATMESAG
jgi:RNA polymerase sigma-70 factor, ECF subfamily